ncbi:MAG TPA: LacI family DNA-binding transcriptional regulator [Angustibacter sp.]|nr:LacI family DNA-binding transcriptional regulator [Angustibacter sp.]
MSQLRQGRPRAVDVARLAGVSPKTVSNVVNGYAHVSADLRQRVQAAIDQLNYVPNTMARTLRTGRTGIIALALPDLSFPYFAEIAREVTAAAEELGFTILIDQTEGRPARERQIASGLRPHAIDGLIFSPLAMTAGEIAVAAGSTPMVLLGERDRPADLDHVAIDNVEAARVATRHLLDAGRRRVAVIGAPVDARLGSGELRVDGYRAALAECGVVPDPHLVIPSRHLLRSEGVLGMRRLLALDNPPDAVFCCNDLLALGAMYEARRQGLSVPDDIAFAGFDDVEDGQYSNPTLTTISPDKRGIARTAVQLLVDRLLGRRTGDEQVVARFDLVVRESSGGRPPDVPDA